jgi:hypothetical protein
MVYYTVSVAFYQVTVQCTSALRVSRYLLQVSWWSGNPSWTVTAAEIVMWQWKARHPRQNQNLPES